MPGVLDDALKLEFFNVLDEFCRTSYVWQESISFSVTTSTATYEISSLDDGTTLSLLWVQNADEINVNATMAEPGVVVLAQLPSQSQTLTARVALTVTDPVRLSGDLEGWPKIPEWILEKYFQELLSGLLGRMMAQPAKPYSNQQLAVYHLRRFRNGITTARAESRRENTYDGQRWQFPGGW